METKIKEFWKYFQEIQMELLIAKKTDNTERFTVLFALLHNKLIAIKKNMELIITTSEDDLSGILVFLTKGKSDLKRCCLKMQQLAPEMYSWELFIGIQPHFQHINDISSVYQELDLEILSEHLYINILRQFKTSNKLHLEIYVKTKRPMPSKETLHRVIENMLLLYFGDALYYTRISRFRIIRRKFRNRNFIPLHALKDFLDYNYVT